jgi:sarcosine oxidase subunit gamma
VVIGASDSDLKPTVHPRRSFVYRLLDQAGATFMTIGDAMVAATIGGDAQHEAARAREMGLIDLSPLPRTGFKGRGALDWLRSQGVTIGEENNVAYPQPDGALAARLASSEALILGDAAGSDAACRRLDEAWSLEASDGAYIVPRRSANFWFRITGCHAATMFAKICGVDLRPHKFPDHAIAQTSIARTNGIAIRDDLGDLLAFHLLGDSASAEYLWRCLVDAMDEFGGGPVGYLALNVNK